jgi:UV DNA damage endonuclease
MVMKLGYCCINLHLQEKSKVTVNRTMVRKTFQQKGIAYASELALKNVTDLATIIEWNYANNICGYRMSSDMFPWMSEYELIDLPDFNKIKAGLIYAGSLAKKYSQRITFHPGPYNVLASPTESIVEKALKDLRQHGEIMDLMGLDRSPFYSINIHIGGTYGDKVETLKRFCDNFQRLDKSAASRLVIENDDKLAQYTVQDLYDGIYSRIGLPITFDYLHHLCNPGDLGEEAALRLAVSSWPIGIQPLTHYSSSKKVNEDASAIYRAHADYIYEKINTYGLDIHIELEAKAKEKALLNYLENNC